MPSVLITGAGRGIGLAATRRLAAAGWDVFAGLRRLEDATVFDGAGPGRITPLQLDVTDGAHVEALPGLLPERLDALVNNAGIAVGGPVEGVPIEDLRNQLEVNVVGPVAVTQAVLPRIRAARGRVVFMSSASGRVSAPMLGPYTASKFALEALADALRLEVRPWGIRVILIEPGSIDTDIWRNVQDTVDEAEAALAPETRELYARHTDGMRRASARIQKQTAPVEKVSDAVHRALTAERPKARYVVGADARIQIALRAALPTPAFDAAVAKLTGVPSKAT
jgi:NAD(P)-dependent dehydrogenase (short-subunit alcohol dehydrogenase family)